MVNAVLGCYDNQQCVLTTMGYLLEVFMDTFHGLYFHLCLELALET